MKNRVVHFEVQADNVERAKNFYTKTFGWEIKQVMTADDKGNMDYWLLTTGPKDVMGINGGLYKRPEDKKVYTFDCTIEVEDLDNAVEAIKENGGKIEIEKMEMPKIGWFARAKDTEGNIFALMQASPEMNEM